MIKNSSFFYKTFTSKMYGEKCFPRLKNTKENIKNIKNGEMDNKSTYSLLCQINSDLFDKYGEHPIYKILDDNKEKQAPQPVNRNEAYWNKCFDEIKERMEQKPQTRGLLDHIAKKLLNISEKEKGGTFDKKLIDEYMKNWKDDIYYLRAYYLK